ncbi:MAG TPA: hypothetical protein VGK18_04180 [Propionicimonas sp.]|uniref:hypothetical protein n=1 Tax=Propionicimonas sp. TaxID=1955623 RepID=UPI002F402557
MNTPRRMNTDTLALVESPAQLLHVLEWCHAEQSATRTRLVILDPADPVTVAQLRAMAEFAAEEGIETEWFAPRASALAGMRTIAALRGAVGAARRLVVGDPFSGLIQALLPFAKASEVVVVDDGTATLEFASQLEHGTSLRRWDSAPGTGLLRVPLARNARSFFASGRLRLFTVMTVTSLPGSRIQHHAYDWTRRRFGPPVRLRGLDVIGSSLAETGVVDTESYLDAVTSLALDAGAGGRYFAHRREDPDKLRRLAQRSGLRIVRPTVPLEVELRRGPVATRLASFPSSVGYTLPLVLAGVGTRIAVQPLPDTMIRPHVTAGARAFLDRMAEDMRHAASGLAVGRYELTSA